MSRRGWFLFLALGVIWGLPYLFIKLAVEYVPPASLVFLRTALGALILVPLAAARGELRPLLPAWKPVLAYTAIEVAVPWLLLNHAETRLSSSLAGLLLAAVPLVGATLGWLTRTDRLDWRRALGLAIGVAGVAALVGFDLGSGDVLALLEMAGTAIGYAVGPFIIARYLTHLPGLGVVAASLLLTAIVYAVPAAFQLPSLSLPGSAVTQVVGSVVVLAVVCTVTAFLFLFKLIEEVGPARATVIPYLNPAVAVALGVVFLNEPFTAGIAVGFVLVLLGSALATRRSRSATPPDPLPTPATG
jgi:drug/metabolite transporter (DMT)-like permease